MHAGQGDKSSNTQAFVALQYLVHHQLFVKVVGGYAKTHFDFSFSNAMAPTTTTCTASGCGSCTSTAAREGFARGYRARRCVRQDGELFPDPTGAHKETQRITIE